MRNQKFAKKYAALAIAAVILVGALTAALIIGGGGPKPKDAPAAAAGCGSYRKDLTVTINGQAFQTELAKSTQEFAKGLGGRPCILPNQGMLFSFTKPGQYRFWMKDMKFPIDIVWIGSNHRVAALEIDVEPSTYNSKNPFFENDSSHLAQYVLEIKANRSKDLHIGLGTPVAL